MAVGKTTNEIAVIGELNVDLIASGLQTERILPGQEVLARDFEMTLGSASAIFASGAARLGHGVTFVSRVGNDDFGKYCIDALQTNGVSTRFTRIDDSTKTGVTIVLSTPDDRSMVTYPGAISELKYEDIPLEVLSGHRHLHLTSYFLQLALQAEFPRLMSDAKKRGLTVSFDPNSDPSKNWDPRIFAVIEQSDILFLNKDEAIQLTKTDDVPSAIAQLGKLCGCVVIKLGKQGAMGIEKGEIAVVEGFAVDAVDTTGAGDSFAAGFVHAFLNGKDFGGCLTIGNACGALSATRTGGTTAQPYLKDLEEFLAKRQRSVTFA